MLASIPASILNQNYPDLGIPNRFSPNKSNSRLASGMLPERDASKKKIPCQWPWQHHQSDAGGKREKQREQSRRKKNACTTLRPGNKQ